MRLVRYIAQFLVFLISWWFLADFYVIEQWWDSRALMKYRLYQKFFAFDKMQQQGPGVYCIQR